MTANEITPAHDPVRSTPMDRTMDRRWDLAGSLAFVALGIAVIVGALTYPTPEIVFDAIGPMGVPLVLGGFLAIGGAVSSIRTIVGMRREGRWALAEGTEDELDEPSVEWRAPAIMGGSFLYLALLQPVGYLIMTPLALYGALTAMRYRTWRWRLLVSLGFTVVSYLVFSQVLRVPLPNGLLDALLFSLGLAAI